ncbi:hypothetical protein GCM10023310_65230 [Paenibacillus vulneris]
MPIMVGGVVYYDKVFLSFDTAGRTGKRLSNREFSNWYHLWYKALIKNVSVNIYAQGGELYDQIAEKSHFVKSYRYDGINRLYIGQQACGGIEAGGSRI